MTPQARRSSYDLVSFTKPPVAEVALTVQFDRDTVDLEALGFFSQRVRDEFPIRQNQPLLPAITETFDLASATPSIEIRFEAPNSLPRLWFQSESGVELIQLQHDRLTFNWRRLDEGGTYPRYAHLRGRIDQFLTVLAGCLAKAGSSAGGQSLAINLCEVVYVNPVEYPRRAEKRHPDLSKILNRVRPRPRTAFLPDAEDAQFQSRWRIPAAELGRKGAAPTGRLYVSAAPALKPPKNTPIYLVNLTARLVPTKADRRSAMKALDVGHKWVVLGFKDITTPEMQRSWGISEEGES